MSPLAGVLQTEVPADTDLRVPPEVRLDATDAIIAARQRLAAENRELSLTHAKLLADYRQQIDRLLGAKKAVAAPRYAEICQSMAAIRRNLPHTTEGEKQALEAMERLVKEKHEFYHSLGLDTKAVRALRAETLAHAREAIDRLICVDQEAPQKTGVKPPQMPARRAVPYYDLAAEVAAAVVAAEAEE